MDLYNKIRNLYPQLTDADFITSIRLQDDGDGPYIAKWGLPLPQPTSSQLVAARDVPVPQSVTNAQARLVLLQSNQLDAVETAVRSMSREAQIGWEYRPIIHRNNPFVIEAQAAMGWSDAELDELFIQAAGM